MISWSSRRSRQHTGALTYAESSWLTSHLAAYTSAARRPLTEPELDALPHEMALVGLYQAIEAGFVAGDPPRAIARTLSIEPQLTFIEWLVEHATFLRDSLTGVIGRQALER